jgi:cystathionine beta-lyase/cystathionine gamma-synthase
MKQKFEGWNTRLVHEGEISPKSEGAVSMPIYQSSTFLQPDGDVSYNDLKYIRLNNLPNQVVVAEKLARLEGAEAGLVAASGMAAISAALLGVLQAGDHLLAQDVLYGGTRSFLTDDLCRMGIEVSFVEGDTVAEWESALRPNTRAVYVESMTNPLLRVIDLVGVAAMARDHGAVSLIDNTVASPLYFRPLDRGFDLSLHSATKYLNGHSDIVAGAVLGRADLVEATLNRLNHLGGSLDPHACSLLHRGVRTLQLRLSHQSRVAQALAEFLHDHVAVDEVYYPGLPSHPDHLRARELFDGFGALLSFRLTAGESAAERLVRAVQLPAHAPSFGGLESLVTRPATSSHAGLSAEARARQGIDGGLLRVAVGIEDAVDLIADFDQALG